MHELLFLYIWLIWSILFEVFHIVLCDVLIPRFGLRGKECRDHKGRHLYFEIALSYWDSWYSSVTLSFKYSAVIYRESSNRFIVGQRFFFNISHIILIVYDFWVINWAGVSVDFAIMEKTKPFLIKVSALNRVLFFILGISNSYSIHTSYGDWITCLQVFIVLNLMLRLVNLYYIN